MSRLLVCGFGPFPRAPDNPAALTVRRLEAEGWSPQGAQTAYAVLPTVWAKAPDMALQTARAQDCDGVLLIGVAVSAPTFRLETRGQNRASRTQPDAEGAVWPGEAIEADGPAERPVGLAVEALRDAVAEAGLPVMLSSDAGDYLCNFTLYRMLADQPRTAFLHVPAVGHGIALDDIVAAARAAAQAFAAQLS